MKAKQLKEGTSKRLYEQIISQIGNNIEWFEDDFHSPKDASIDMTTISECDNFSLDQLKR